MKSIETFLQQNKLKNKTSIEQKKYLRNFLTKRRIEQYNFCHQKTEWGKKQFFNALNQLNISDPLELQSKFQIASFFPIRGELNLLPYTQSNWLMPKVHRDTLHWFEYGDGTSDYTLNQWGIPEKSDKYCFEFPSSHKPLLCFVPGLAGDSNQYRLGYGGGYYDKFLAKYPEIISVLCLPSAEFFFDHLPHDTHDIQMDLVVY